MGVSGSVTYLYTYASLISVEGISEEEALEAILEAGIDLQDIAEEDGIVMITGAPGDLDAIKDALDATGKELNYLEDSVTYIPMERITLQPEDVGKFQRFLNMTNDLDDVQDIYHNADFPDSEE